MLHNETREALTHEASDHEAVSILVKSNQIRGNVNFFVHDDVAKSTS